jgi:hypothetical protein
MNKLFSTLTEPYPYYDRSKNLIGNSLLVFIAVLIFLFLFSPFKVNEAEHKYGYFIICAIHAANAAAIYFLYFSSLNTIFSVLIKEDNWKVYKAIVVLAVLFFLIGLGSFLIRPLIYNNSGNFTLHYFIIETVNTFLAGTLIFAVITLFDFYRLLKLNRLGASGFDTELGEQKADKSAAQPINLIIEKDHYQLNISEFLFSKSEGNYVEFYFIKDGQIYKDLKRASLKSIEEQLANIAPTLIKTHRAFLVNTKHIIKITGNAQGYQLYFENIDFPVPVSRALIPGFKAVMKGN